MNKTTSTHNIGTLLALLLCAPLLPGCAFYGGSVSGHVYEWIDQSKPPTKDNLKPVPDVYVVATWTGTIPRPIAAGSTCLNVKLGKTDMNGHYKIPGWFRFPRFYPVFVDEMHEMDEGIVSKYKPGYQQKDWIVNGLGTAQFNLVPSTQTPDERIRSLERAVTFYCPEIGGDERRELQPLYKAAYEEARSLHGISENIRYKVDWIKSLIDANHAGHELK